MATAVLAGLALLTACGVAVTSADQPGTVTGQVRMSPCRPVQRVDDPPCPPVAGVPVELDEVGGTGARFSAVTDASGTYRAEVRAGTYEVRAERGVVKMPAIVTVARGQTVHVDLTFDAGIR
jgi:hypothetical protein